MTHDHWSIFSANTPDPSSATWCSLQWLRGSSFLDEGTLAQKFKRAGDDLIEHLSCERHIEHPDAMFMPIANLYRHALELKLKHLVGLACDAELIARSNRVNEALSMHDLRRLWNPARRAIVARWPNEDQRVVDRAEAMIRDFEKIDASGQSLRYTHDRAGRPTSTSYPDSIDLEDFKVAFGDVFDLLDGCSAEFAENADYVREARSRGEG